MSGEPVYIEVTDGDVWVNIFTGPNGQPRIQLDIAGGKERATAVLSLEDATKVAAALLEARAGWLRRAAARARRLARPGTP